MLLRDTGWLRWPGVRSPRPRNATSKSPMLPSCGKWVKTVFARLLRNSKHFGWPGVSTLSALWWYLIACSRFPMLPRHLKQWVSMVDVARPRWPHGQRQGASQLNSSRLYTPTGWSETYGNQQGSQGLQCAQLPKEGTNHWSYKWSIWMMLARWSESTDNCNGMLWGQSYSMDTGCCHTEALLRCLQFELQWSVLMHRVQSSSSFLKPAYKPSFM